MDIFAPFSNFVVALPSYIIPFLFVLTIIVFFHELGHFVVARWCGVKVEVFSVGFGRELFGFNDKHGTRWKFSWIPLGGYVKFFGDEGAASTPDTEKLKDMNAADKSGSFHHKGILARSAVVAAGPIANFLLAIVIFAGIFMLFGRHVTAPVADAVVAGSAAEEAGFKNGDVIKSIDGKEIETFGEMQRIVSASADRKLVFVVERGGERVTLTATPRRTEQKDGFGNTHRMGQLGIKRETTRGNVTRERFGPGAALVAGAEETWFVIARTMSYLYELVVGREEADQLGGPLRIAQMSGQVASVSFAALLNLAAVLSVSIGLINLFPVPMLDGGHLVFYLIEAVRGKPLSERAQEYGFRIGFALVIMLMVFATWNDLVHFDIF